MEKQVEKLAEATLVQAARTEAAAERLVRQTIGEDPKVPAEPQVIQLVRNIGAIDSPDTMAVSRVNAELAHMLGQGWKLHTARTLGILPGGVSVYYLLTKP